MNSNLLEYKEVRDLGIVGGGASGLACAVVAAKLGLSIIVFEKMERCGHKLSITGGRKCNFTHEELPESMVERFEQGSRLLPLLRRFPYERIVSFFRSMGIRSRTDASGCVWPEGLDASGVRDRLVQEVQSRAGKIVTSCRVTALKREVEKTDSHWVVVTSHGEFYCRNVCLATGGASFPQTGSTGEGLALCRSLGLRTTAWFPALCALRPKEDLSCLAGITHRCVRSKLIIDGRVERETDGPFVFAHEYLSGAAVLVPSGRAAKALNAGKDVKLKLDWVPDKSREEIRAELVRARNSHPRQQIVTFLARYVARRLGRVLCSLGGLEQDRLLCHLSRTEQELAVDLLKGTVFVIVGTEPIERATVTGGGVSLDEIDITTCQVRRIPGLYVAGELLDTWAETGGYNLHLAWATGIAVAEAIAARKSE